MPDSTSPQAIIIPTGIHNVQLLLCMYSYISES